MRIHTYHTVQNAEAQVALLLNIVDPPNTHFQNNKKPLTKEHLFNDRMIVCE
jgi:hypothetical protein